MYNQNHESGIIMDKKGKNITSYKNADRYDDQTADIVAGRNPVIELLKSDREIDKLYVQRGSREGSINLIIAEAKKNGVPIIDTDKSKLDLMCRGLSHQGVAAIAAYVVLAVSGEFPVRWTITFLLGVSFVVIGTIGIIDYTKKNKYL